MLEMIGVGPFITLPLVIAAAGYKLSVWAWLLGAAIAVADGLVWAELGAAFPRAGGSYAFLREIYGPERAGNWLSFLYVWQLSFSAPLSIASGCIGLSSFLAWFWPGLEQRRSRRCLRCTMRNFAAAASVPAGDSAALSKSEFGDTAGVGAVYWRDGGDDRRDCVRICACCGDGWMAHAGFSGAVGGCRDGGLAQATLIATYDYWGYYNITFLGSEVRQPEKTIPRAILLSVLFVSAFYVTMNLAALPSMRDAAVHTRGERRSLRVQLVAEIARSAFGRWAGYTIAALVMWTAFASVFSLLLGYSRVPYAAARDGNYFRVAGGGASEAWDSAPVAGGAGAGGFSVLLLLAAAGDHDAGDDADSAAVFPAAYGRDAAAGKQRPELERPFRIPFYPLPPLAAMAGFVFILVNRSHALGGLASGCGHCMQRNAIYLWRAKRLGQWPFVVN